jgi:uncharacterized membrane protein
MRAALNLLGAVFVLAYPLAVYFGLPRLGTHTFGLALAALLLVGLPLRLVGRKREHVWPIVRIPLTVIGLLLVGALFDDRRFVLALPVLTNVLFLAQFGASLRTTPIAERFARAQEDDLSDAQIAYCRAVTAMWCGFFFANGAVSALLAIFAPLGWWTAYTGALGYVLVGLLASGEYLVRKHRFRKYNPHLLDRLIARVFPPGAEASRAPGPGE